MIFANERPICYNGYIPFAPGLESDEYLFFSCLRKQGSPPSPPFSEKESQVRAFFLKLAAEEFHLRRPSEIAFKFAVIEKAIYALRWEEARMHVAIADILAASSDSENIKNARANYLAAIEIFPSAYNPAVRKAIAFFAHIGENESRLHLLAKYGDKLETINPRLRLE